MKLRQRRKVKRGSEIKRLNIREQIANEVHKPVRKKFIRRSVIVKGLSDLFQADLVEMIPYARQNKGYKYILVVINAFSKYVWASALKTKKGNEVAVTMSKILKQPHIPKNLQTDDGKEFFNKDFKDLVMKLKINHYSTYSGMKASIVERVNRTLKEKMWKVFTAKQNYKWLDLLPTIVRDYNNTVHSKIHMKPVDVSRKNEKKN
jgi:hypothetical protein